MKYLLVPPPGIEPGSWDFQSPAMTTFAKAAMVPCDRIELPSLLCKSRALPLDEQGTKLGYLMRIELIRRESQSLMLPLHHRHHIEAHYFLFIFHGRLVYGNVLLYGGGAGERSLFYWLKASYFTLKFHPHWFGYFVTVHLDSP